MEPFTCARIVSSINDYVDSDELPPELLVAVVKAITDSAAANHDEGEEWVVLNVERCATMAGRAVLEDWYEQNKGKDGKNDMMYVSFMSKWKATVPDECCSVCKLDLLKDCHVLPTPNTIHFVREGSEMTFTGLNTATIAAIPPKNKWHERFKRG